MMRDPVDPLQQTALRPEQPAQKSLAVDVSCPGSDAVEKRHPDSIHGSKLGVGSLPGFEV